MKSYAKLKTICSELSKLNYIENIMIWDEAAMMPEGAGETLSHALALLNSMTHKMLSNKKNKKLIEQAKEEFNRADASITHWDKANLYWIEKKYLRASVIPSKLTEKYTKESFACQQAWRKLREQNNWRDFAPYLQRTFKLAQDIAKRYSDVLHVDPYDAMLDQYAPGFSQATIDPVFSQLKTVLPPLIQEIVSKQSREQVLLPQGPFAIEQQKQIGLEVMKALAFDFNHGRLDISHHPFCIGTATDVRITTRYKQGEFISSLLGICHETGHGLYEQGMPAAWRDQPVGHVNSMAMHESQSLLLEMQVCKSNAFFEYISSSIQKQFGHQDALTADNLYRIVTRVQPSLIRVDADEVTYPLHVILRYEIEKKLFNKEITVRDLPAIWDEHMQKYLGLSTDKNDKDGVMQDVHWPSGAFGYFPAYTLGRLIASQLFSVCHQAHPDLFDQVKMGNFQPLKTWLNENIYSYASSLKTADLLMKVTGQPLDSEHFIRHIKARYLS